MADYFPVISRAVAGLENNTGEARRAVYERARAAIVRQLRSIDPPVSEEEISRERMQLEEAIRRVESSTGATVETPKPAPAQKPEPSPAQKPASVATPARPDPRPASPEAARPPQEPERPAAAAKHGRDDAPGHEPEAAPTEPAVATAARPTKRPDGRPIIQAAGSAPAREGSKRSGAVIAVALLAVVAIGGGLFLARDTIFGGGESQVAATSPAAPAPSESKPSEPSAATSSENKSDDRLPQDGVSPAQGETAQPAPAQVEPQPSGDSQVDSQVARAPDATAPAPPAETPATPPAEQAAPAQTGEQPAPAAAPLVAQRAVLYEEGPNQQSGEAVTGTVVWRTESVSAGPNQPLEMALRGDVEVPGRKMRATLTIRRNLDSTLPASHTIELQFTLPDDFPNAGISNVPGLLMKADESARGAAVAGLSVRVTNGFFLIGLSNLDSERTVNEQLLKDRGWIDVPVLYDNGRRAVLTLEKGTPGTQAFTQAFAAWQSASSAANAPGAAPR